MYSKRVCIRGVISCSTPYKRRPRWIFSRQQQHVLTGLTLSCSRCYQLAILPCSQRHISSPAVLLHDKRRSADKPQNPAVILNKKIVSLGKKKDWEGILQIYEEGSKFNNINYATTMSQLGRIPSFDGTSHPSFLTFLEDLANKIETMGLVWIGIRETANIIHAIGKMKLSNDGAKRITDWMSHPEIAEQFVASGKPQHIATTAWAFARTGIVSMAFFTEVNKRAAWLVKEGKPQEVANTAWACGTLGFDAVNLFAQIDQKAEWLVQEGKPQDIANTAWAFGELGFNAGNLFAQIDKKAEWLVKEGKPQEVANTAWACGKLGFDARNLFHEIDRRAETLVKEGKSQAIANTAWAFGTLGFDATNLFIELETGADDILPQFNTQGIANTCFAIAVSGYSNKFQGLLQKLWDIAMLMSYPEDNHKSNINLCQLAQAQLFAKADGVKLSQPTMDFVSRMDEAINQSDDNVVTDQHKDVFTILNSLGLCCEFGVSPLFSANLDRMLAVNLGCKERKVAIEYHGPFDFLKELGSGKVTAIKIGSTKAKLRFLQKLGWNVVSIDYRDWSTAKHGGNEKRWLEEKLVSSGIELQMPKDMIGDS